MHRSAMLCKYAPAIHSASARRRVFRCRARAKWRLRELQMSCVLRICLLHPPSADRGVPLKARYAPRTTHTHSGSSEKWWPTGVTPHALRIRFTHSHAQGVGEGLRTTYYAHAFRIRVRSGGRRGLRLTYYAYVLRIRTPKVSERAYAPRTTHTHSGFE